MKNIYVSLLILWAINSAFTQENSTYRFHINSGIVMPYQPKEFDKHWTIGYNLGSGLDLILSPGKAIQLYADYQHFPFDKKSISHSGTLYGGTITIATLAMNFKLSHADNYAPYLLIGPNYFHIEQASSSGIERVTAASDNAFGINGGIGFEFQVNSISLFIEGQYRLGFNKGRNIQYLPIKIGMSF
ncbi:hypothetical protein K1X84_09965 [bacterium]|nr:hypothetical protein [bacterium]